MSSSRLGSQFRSSCPLLVPASSIGSLSPFGLLSFSEWFICINASPLAPSISDPSLGGSSFPWPPSSASRSDCFFFLRSMSVLNRRLTVKQTLHLHDGRCLPFPLGGWMQTMQEQPGRCRGCFVVAPTPAEGSPKSPMLSPSTATVANASNPEGSQSWPFSVILRLLESMLSLKNASSSFGLNSSGAEHEHLFASQILSTHVHLGGRRA
nr:hypothetical protein Iba_chr07dCG2520 [Ipomoea batatas]